MLTAEATATLQAMAATGSAYLTAAQGQALVEDGLITVGDANPADPTQFACALTDAGTELLTCGAQPPVVAAVAPVVAAVAPSAADYVLVSDIAMPAIKRGGATGPRVAAPEKYPFSKMEIGQSFHVALGEDPEKESRTLSTQVSNANKASRVPAVPATEEIVTRKRGVKDATGNAVYVNSTGVVVLKGTEGAKRQMEEYTETVAVTVQQKFFACRKVGATDPGGVGIRVFRNAEAS